MCASSKSDVSVKPVQGKKRSLHFCSAEMRGVRGGPCPGVAAPPVTSPPRPGVPAPAAALPCSFCLGTARLFPSSLTFECLLAAGSVSGGYRTAQGQLVCMAVDQDRCQVGSSGLTTGTGAV